MSVCQKLIGWFSNFIEKDKFGTLDDKNFVKIIKLIYSKDAKNKTKIIFRFGKNLKEINKFRDKNLRGIQIILEAMKDSQKQNEIPIITLIKNLENGFQIKLKKKKKRKMMKTFIDQITIKNNSKLNQYRYNNNPKISENQMIPNEFISYLFSSKMQKDKDEKSKELKKKKKEKINKLKK
ncbi:hypothetical protein M0811_14254 [Anaeramoeba ignava]|uniref:Uncharacterized protein n=1 Tax=Anaeramoeba ignava TaxID=1746090 RepID=A0A9Q0RGD8_ANAIG|nr:hypothetical protein M0811_14254 [Anaeramoeba ignava]